MLPSTSRFSLPPMIQPSARPPMEAVTSPVIRPFLLPATMLPVKVPPVTVRLTLPAMSAELASSSLPLPP